MPLRADSSSSSMTEWMRCMLPYALLLYFVVNCLLACFFLYPSRPRAAFSWLQLAELLMFALLFIVAGVPIVVGMVAVSVIWQRRLTALKTQCDAILYPDAAGVTYPRHAAVSGYAAAPGAHGLPTRF
jgi:hypothetical protein